MEVFNNNNNIMIINDDMFSENGISSLNNQSIDAVITDFPYGTLNKRNEWDKVIDYNLFWKDISRVIKDTSPIISTAQMPISLFEWLIKTYTNEGDTVLDPCMGSGTTAIACMRTHRKFIGIEKDTKYYEIAKNRIINEINSNL